MQAQGHRHQVEEQELLRRIATGDEAAFAMLFNQYKDNIYSTVLRLSGQQWLAEEVLQDSFLKVWLKRSELPALQNFGGWLHTVASRLAINAVRDARQKPLTAQQDHISSAEEILLDKQYQGILQQAISKLPPRQQQAFRLVKEQGMKREEAAAIMEISPETIKYHLEQSVRSLRLFLAAHIGEVPVAVIFVLAQKYF